MVWFVLAVHTVIHHYGVIMLIAVREYVLVLMSNSMTIPQKTISDQ